MSPYLHPWRRFPWGTITIFNLLSSRWTSTLIPRNRFHHGRCWTLPPLFAVIAGQNFLVIGTLPAIRNFFASQNGQFSETPAYPCPSCHLVFSRHYARSRHLMIRHVSKTCRWCLRTFRDPTQCKSHLPQCVQCPLLQANFSRQCSLRRH